jgi:hypothetical protein
MQVNSHHDGNYSDIERIECEYKDHAQDVPYYAIAMILESQEGRN